MKAKSFFVSLNSMAIVYACWFLCLLNTASAQLIGPMQGANPKVTARVSNRILWIDGTNNADSILVKIQSIPVNGQAGRLGSINDVQSNGRSIAIANLRANDLSSAIVTNVVIHAYQGNDTVDCSTVQVSCHISGGMGDDSLYGSPFPDILIGGNGNDFLSGAQGNDELYGLNGNDTLRGGRGADYLEGGDGDDQCHGDLDLDRVVPGNGRDGVFLGNAEIQGSVFVYDVLVGFSLASDIKLDPANVGWSRLPR